MKLPSFKHSILVTLLLLLSGCVWAQTRISTSGSIEFSGLSSAVQEAGEDIPSTYTTVTDAVELDLFRSGFFANLFPYNWQVEINRLDTEWHPSLRLRIIRTGAGTGVYSFFTGGTVPQEIGTTSAFFLEGSGYRVDIPLQFELSGLSVTLPAKTYRTTVLFTVTDL